MLKKIDKQLLWSLLAMLLAAGGVYWLMTGNKKPDKFTYFFSGQLNDFCFNNVCIKQRGNGFVVNDGKTEAPADSDLASSFIKTLTQLKIGEVVSANPGRADDFGLGEKSPVTLVGEGKKLDIGTMNSSYDGTYVRISGSNMVNNSDQIINKEEVSQFTYWQQKYITNFPKLQIVSVVVDNGKRNIEIKPDKDGKWKDDKFVDLISYLPSVNFFNNIDIGSTKSWKIIVKTEGDEKNIIIGEIVGKPSKYFGSIDEANFFEISKDSFTLLTSIIK